MTSGKRTAKKRSAAPAPNVFTDLVDRLRPLFAAMPTREVPMFGGLSFMADDRMVVAAGKDGSLLVRVDPARHDELTARPGAAVAEMGTGRSMGPGWLRVQPEAIADETGLRFWFEAAMDFHDRLR